MHIYGLLSFERNFINTRNTMLFQQTYNIGLIFQTLFTLRCQRFVRNGFLLFLSLVQTQAINRGILTPDIQKIRRC